MINYCVIIGSASPQYYANDDVFVGGNRYDGRLIGQPQWGQWLFGVAKTRGDVDIPTVSFQLINADGALDGYALMQSRLLDADKLGYLFAVLEDGTQVPCCSFIIDTVVADTNQVTISGREWVAQLSKPFAVNRYAGSNTGTPLAGIEGTAADIKGQVKPQLYGTVFNIEPVCVNTTKLIYQFHDGALATGYAQQFYDRRAALTFNATLYTNQADMEANQPVAGQYRLWPAGGCIRLGASPAGRVTGDVTNPVNTSPGTGQTNVDIQYIITKMLTLAGYTEASQMLLVQAAYGSTTPMNQKGGIYITDTATYMQLLNLLAGSLMMGFYTRPTNRPSGGAMAFYFRRLVQQHIGPASVILSLSNDNILPNSVKPIACADPDRGNPIIGCTVGYQKNYTVMSNTDAPTVTDAVRASISVDQLTVTATGPNAGPFPNNPQLLAGTQLADVNGANDLRDYLGFGGAIGNGVGYGDVTSKNVYAVEIPESVFIGASASDSAPLKDFGTNGGLFDSGCKVTTSGLRYMGSNTYQLLSYQATGRRTFALTLRDWRY